MIIKGNIIGIYTQLTYFFYIVMLYIYIYDLKYYIYDHRSYE